MRLARRVWQYGCMTAATLTSAAPVVTVERSGRRLRLVVTSPEFAALTPPQVARLTEAVADAVEASLSLSLGDLAPVTALPSACRPRPVKRSWSGRPNVPGARS